MKKWFSFISLLINSYTLKSQIISDSLMVEGRYRIFHFKNPAYETKDFNLIFVLHGSGGNGKGMIKAAEKLEGTAGEEPVFLVYPDGYKRYWNECRKMATSAANKENINEQAFFEGMVDYFHGKYRVKKKGFYAIGLSGGGHMAYKLALTMPDKCKAVCAVVANLPDNSNLDCEEARKPVPVMIINSTDDVINPYNGGQMKVNNGNFGAVRSTEQTFNYWASLAGYKRPARVAEIPDTNPNNKQTITKYTFQKKRKPEIILLKVNGGIHASPQDINAFTEAWQFFKRQK